MSITIKMIRRVREIQNQRGPVQSGIPTLFDIRLGQLICYLRHRHYREYGYPAPI